MPIRAATIPPSSTGPTADEVWRAAIGSYNAAMHYRLRTLLIVMLVLGALPWLMLRYLEWQKDRSLKAWRVAYSMSVDQKTESANEQVVRAQVRYFAARQRLKN